MPWTREENILRYYLFGDEIIQKCLKIDATNINMIMIYSKDKKLKKIACPGNWYYNN